MSVNSSSSLSYSSSASTSSASYTTPQTQTPDTKHRDYRPMAFKEIFSNFTKYGATSLGHIEVDNGDLFCTTRVRRPVLVRQLSCPNLGYDHDENTPIEERKVYISERQLMRERDGIIWKCDKTTLDTYGGRLYRFRLNKEYDYITNGDPDKVIKQRLKTQINASFPGSEPTPSLMRTELDILDETEIGKTWIGLNPSLRQQVGPCHIIGRELGYAIEFTPVGVFLTLPDNVALEARYQRIRSVIPQLDPLTIISVNEIADDHSFTFVSCITRLQAKKEFLHDTGDHILGTAVQAFKQTVTIQRKNHYIYGGEYNLSANTFSKYNFSCAKLVLEQYRNLEMMHQMARANYSGKVSIITAMSNTSYPFPEAYARLQQTFKIIKILLSVFQDSFSGNSSFTFIPNNLGTSYFIHENWGPYLANRLKQEPPFGAKSIEEFLFDLSHNMKSISSAVNSFKTERKIKLELRARRKQVETRTPTTPSSLSFHPSVVPQYGKSGEESIRKMSTALGHHSLSITYNENSKQFTVIGSSNLDKNAIIKIFATFGYEVWEPQVLDETDPSGNRLVVLKQKPRKSIFDLDYQFVRRHDSRV